MITMFLPGFEHPEVVMMTDVPMLASLRMRRLGRQWARLNLGVDGKRAMAQYQLAATELAMACNRNSFGRTTEEAYARHRDDSLDLMRAAAAIVRCHEQLYQPPWIGPDDPSVFRHRRRTAVPADLAPPSAGPAQPAESAELARRRPSRYQSVGCSSLTAATRRPRPPVPNGAPSCRSSHSLRSRPPP